MTCGGGGGGGGGGASVFEPNAREGAGSFTLILVTKDPFGKESMAQTMFELQRSTDLKRTMPIAPTTGLLTAGAIS